MKGMRITYAEVKRRQQEDFRTYPTQNLYNVYRRFSSVFTYLFLRLGITPNQITFIYFFCCIFGGILLAAGTYLSMLLGVFFFLVFKVLDDSDGEVARIQKSHSAEGVYLDRVGHYIYSFCLGMGLAIGIFRLHKNEVYLMISAIFTFAIIIEHSIIDLLKSTLRKKVLEESFNKTVKKDRAHQIEMTRMVNESRAFSKQDIFLKIFGVYPIQGLLYSEHIYTLLIGALILGEYLLAILIPIYLLVIAISKIIWIAGFLYRLDKSRYITKF